MELSVEELRTRLQQDGVLLLRDFLDRQTLTALRAAADRCFKAIDRLEPIPARYGFIPQAHSLLLTSLLDCGIETERDLIAPLNAAVLRELFSSLLGAQWRIRLEHSWARRKFAPHHAPSGSQIQMPLGPVMYRLPATSTLMPSGTPSCSSPCSSPKMRPFVNEPFAATS